MGILLYRRRIRRGNGLLRSGFRWEGSIRRLLFDGDRVYYCTNQSLHPGREEITLEEIDVRTGRLLGAQKTIWSGVGGGFLEAPHVYHIGDWYYLLAAEGGTRF